MHSNLSKLVLLFGLLIGASLTIFGFYSALSAPFDNNAWRWTTQYLGVFIGLSIIIFGLATKVGPHTAGFSALIGLSSLFGFALPLGFVGLFALSAIAIGRLVLKKAMYR